MARIAIKTKMKDGVRIRFANGEEVVVKLDNLSEDIIRQLAIHGLSQKIGDSYAGAESIGEAKETAQGVAKMLEDGLWSLKVNRGGKFAEALARASGKGLEECIDRWKDMGDAKQREVKKNAQFNQALLAIEAERAQAVAERAEEAAAGAGAGGDDLNDMF